MFKHPFVEERYKVWVKAVAALHAAEDMARVAKTRKDSVQANNVLKAAASVEAEASSAWSAAISEYEPS